MHFQYLVEDNSTACLIRILMDKYLVSDNVTYDCKSFKGIGGLAKKRTAKETKTGKLLNDLAMYMRGFSKSLSGIDAAIIVVVDNDDRNTDEFKNELETIVRNNMILIDHVFCIAVEEMEAWLLGDENAIKQAFPHYKAPILHRYSQDSICGTWELLADVVFAGGMTKIRKDAMTWYEIGKLKSTWASEIGQYMDPAENVSPSFKEYWDEITKTAV